MSEGGNFLQDGQVSSALRDMLDKLRQLSNSKMVPTDTRQYTAQKDRKRAGPGACDTVCLGCSRVFGIVVGKWRGWLSFVRLNQ
jgi:hypothetical protein